mgnify:CR=1 FL=1
MDRIVEIEMPVETSIPHTRGDGPMKTTNNLYENAYSPHAWGWTSRVFLFVLSGLVFPTRVGMDRGYSIVIKSI